MHAQAGSFAPPTAPSLTDVILALCASGHFGVREAIAAATRQEPRRLGSDPADAAMTGTLIPATWRRQDRDPPGTPAHDHLTEGEEWQTHWLDAVRRNEPGAEGVARVSPITRARGAKGESYEER